MKRLFAIGLFSLASLQLSAAPKPSTSSTATLYADPQDFFVVEYPAGLLKPESFLKKGPDGAVKQGFFKGYFLSEDKRTHLWVQSIFNKDQHSWNQEIEKTLKGFTGDNQRQITYKAIKEKFLVVSGYEGNDVFYFKEMPCEKNGQRFILAFRMKFPRSERQKWEPVLETCLNSFKPVSPDGSNPIQTGWSFTPKDSDEDEMLELARKWAREHFQCIQYLESENSDDSQGENLRLGKCIIEDTDVEFMNLTKENQFVLSIHGPELITYGCHGAFHGCVVCDQKYVLFTYENKKITGQVIYEKKNDGAFDSYSSALKIIVFPDGRKALLLSTDNQDCGLNGHLIMEVHGSFKNVLDFDEEEVPCSASAVAMGIGFNSVLVPKQNGYLSLIKSNYRNPGSDGDHPKDTDGKNDSYSRISYKFDPSREIYVQSGPEEELLKKPSILNSQ